MISLGPVVDVLLFIILYQLHIAYCCMVSTQTCIIVLTQPT